MVATVLSRYLQEMDKNGVFVKTWAIQTAPGIAMCKYAKGNYQVWKGKERAD